jgi:hypothetical protein
VQLLVINLYNFREMHSTHNIKISDAKFIINHKFLYSNIFISFFFVRFANESILVLSAKRMKNVLECLYRYHSD